MDKAAKDKSAATKAAAAEAKATADAKMAAARETRLAAEEVRRNSGARVTPKSPSEAASIKLAMKDARMAKAQATYEAKQAKKGGPKVGTDAAKAGTKGAAPAPPAPEPAAPEPEAATA